MNEFPNAGPIIRTEMVRCGFTLDTLSQETGVSVPVLRGILNGRSKTISVRNLIALARAFGYSGADFIDLLSGAPSPSET